jgi:hypothetical protein
LLGFTRSETGFHGEIRARKVERFFVILAHANCGD